jgi:hypothetical protein
MLEDESGRIRLTGEALKKARLVTGVIIGVLGAETADGDFEVIDVCMPGLALQPSQGEDTKMDVDGEYIISWVMRKLIIPQTHRTHGMNGWALSLVSTLEAHLHRTL